jgi:hypothetical protein
MRAIHDDAGKNRACMMQMRALKNFRKFYMCGNDVGFSTMHGSWVFNPITCGEKLTGVHLVWVVSSKQIELLGVSLSSERETLETNGLVTLLVKRVSSSLKATFPLLNTPKTLLVVETTRREHAGADGRV